MIKTLKQITQLKSALWVNAFCYYFKRLWLVGKWMPDSIYSHYGLKKTLSVIAVVISQFIGFCGKPLYLLCAVGLPLMMQETLPERGFSSMVQILFFLSCVTGAFGDSQIFMVTRDKVTCIKFPNNGLFYDRIRFKLLLPSSRGHIEKNLIRLFCLIVSEMLPNYWAKK